MQNIDPSIYEAAEIDGATKWDQLFKITIPNLRPIILFTTITSTIGTLQLFDEVQNITGGGPANATTTLSQYIYNLSYKFTPELWLCGGSILCDRDRYCGLIRHPNKIRRERKLKNTLFKLKVSFLRSFWPLFPVFPFV